MALELMLDTLDGVAESVKSLYVAHEGKFKLDVNGIEDTKGLKSALEKERLAAKENLAKRLQIEKMYEGIDPEKTRQFMSKFENDEEAQLIADGKINDVIAKRTEKQRAEWERQNREALAKADAAEIRAKAFQGRVLDDAIRAAASAIGIHKHAIDDALFRGRSIFTLDDNGKAVQLDSDGQPILGKDGKTNFSPSEWLESMKESAPHWFPVGSSGSSASGKGTQATGKQMKRTAFNALSAVEKAATAKAGIAIVD
jgi:hypothetical protein